MIEFIAFMQTPQFWTALGAIILIDLVLAGDNAIVIALAARDLPPNLRKKAIFWGTIGAIVMRVAMTVVVVYLLKIPGLMGLGGAALLIIAVQLLIPGDPDKHATDSKGPGSFFAAMKTIVVADALMGLDNVLAVAGAAGGSFALVVIGLLISIPIVVWASSLVLKLIDRFPATIYVGAAVLALTAAKMISSEPLLKSFFEPSVVARMAMYAVCIVGVLGLGHLLAGRANARRLAGNEPTTSV
jgi:YjbE family integral membrane protein